MFMSSRAAELDFVHFNGSRWHRNDPGSRSLKRHDWLSGVLIEFKTFNNTVMSKAGNTPCSRWDEFCVWRNKNWENTQKDTHTHTLMQKKKRCYWVDLGPPHCSDYLFASNCCSPVMIRWCSKGEEPRRSLSASTCFILANGPGSNENPGSAPVLGTFCDATWIEGRSTCH